MAHGDPYTWNMIKLSKNLKNLIFVKKIVKIHVIKQLITIPSPLANLKKNYYQTLEGVPGMLVQEKNSKNFKYFQNKIQKLHV